MPPGWLCASLFVAALVAGLVVGPRTMRVCSESKVDIPRLTVQAYVKDAYPAWRAKHPDRTCPTSLQELRAYSHDLGKRDPWGRTYVFTCGASGLFVMSVGEDGIANTGDDIWSHERAAQ